MWTQSCDGHSGYIFCMCVCVCVCRNDNNDDGNDDADDDGWIVALEGHKISTITTICRERICDCVCVCACQLSMANVCSVLLMPPFFPDVIKWIEWPQFLAFGGPKWVLFEHFFHLFGQIVAFYSYSTHSFSFMFTVCSIFYIARACVCVYAMRSDEYWGYQKMRVGVREGCCRIYRRPHY